MNVTIPLSTGVVAAVITTVEYILSTIAAFSARATIHGVWLLGLHRGGEAALDARTRTRRGLIKDFASFLLTISLVIATASVESSLQPTWLVLPYAINSKSCVSVLGKFAPIRVEAHSPPFRVSIEPWVVKVSQQLKCVHGISSIGLGSWTDLSGQKQDMFASTCMNKSLDVTMNAVGARPAHYKFSSEAFNVKIMQSQMYTLFPLKINRPGKNIRSVGTAREGKGECGNRGISGYYMDMNANYETMRMHAKNMTYGVHERMCIAHGDKAVKSITNDRVGSCLQRAENQVDLNCVVTSATAEEIYSIRLPDMAALYSGGTKENSSYACVDGIVQIEYLFFSADLTNKLQGSTPVLDENSMVNRPNGPPELPVLVPISVRSVSGRCQRTIASIAQSALLFSAEQEWYNLEFAKMDRLVRFHAYMTAVSDSLFPLRSLPKPESSLHDGTCYVRPVQTETQIPMTWASIFFVVCTILVAVLTLSAFIFRGFFRGESWLVGSARWSLTKLLGDGDEGPVEKETMIQAVPVTTPIHRNVARVPSSFIFGRGASVSETIDWKYEFRFRTKMRSNDRTGNSAAKSQGSTEDSQSTWV